MCDLHGKKLEYFCLHHVQYCCRKCKIKNHEAHPCECMHVRDVYHRLQLDMEEHIHDLVNLRDRSQRIMDGSYQRNLLYRVNDEEMHLDRFYRDMKKKLKETKMQIKAFTSDELSGESRQQLQTFIAKSTPVKFHKDDKPRDMVQQLKNVKKQIRGANNLLYSLPNYIEVSVDQKFVNLLTFNGDPVVIRGRPKFMTNVSSDDEFTFEYDEEDDFESLLFENEDEVDKTGFKRKVVGNTKKAKRKPIPIQNAFDYDNNDVVTGVLKWENNMPAFNSSAQEPKSAKLDIKQTLAPNKYESRIAEVKERLKYPPLSLTPEPVRNIRSKLPKAPKVSARSLPDNVMLDRPVKKLFLRNKNNTKFSVRERFQLDGCEDALVLKNSIILSMIETVQKRDRKTMKMLVQIKLSRSGYMCVINGSDTLIAVMQIGKCITVLETGTGLSIVYRIRIKQPYVDFCHMSTTDTGPVHPSYIFAATYQGYPNLPVNCVDTIQAKETRRPGRPPMYEILPTEINLLNQGYEAKQICGIGAFLDGHVVIGTQDALICINETGKQVWRTVVPREVSGVLCTKSHVYACVQDTKKIITLNKAGFITDDNVIPDLDIIPCRLSANWDIMLIKDFKTKAWVSIVFKHGLFLV